jgi:hypothetical protein
MKRRRSPAGASPARQPLPPEATGVINGATFEAIEAQHAAQFLEQIRGEMTERTYVPLRSRRQAIPKDAAKVRALSIPMGPS